jgi:hypothetical protein
LVLDGSTVQVTVPTPVAAIINVAPVVHVVSSTNQGTVTLVDSSTDANATPSLYLHDTWVYTISYGDGTQATTSAATLGRTFVHTYVTSGTYTITTTVTDAYGASSSRSVPVTVVIPVTGGGGGSSGGGISGGGWFTGVTTNASTTNATTSLFTIAKISNGKVLGVATSTKKLPVKKVPVKTVKSVKSSKKLITVNLKKEVSSPSIDGTTMYAQKVEATGNKSFWSRVSSAVVSIKEKLRLKFTGKE